MVAELTPDNRVLRTLLKKTLAPTAKRDAVDYLLGEEAAPFTRTCTHMGLLRSSYCEHSRGKGQLACHWCFRICFDWMRDHGYE